MIINDKFKYPILERVDTDIGRHYLDSNNKPVPSVTTVLSGTSKSKDGLLQWRSRVGEEEAERIIKQSTDIGTAVHEAIENYLNGKSWDNFEESCMDFYKSKRPVKTASSEQVRQPIYKSGVNYWKNYEDNLTVLKNHFL